MPEASAARSNAHSHAGFQTTQWHLVLAAGEPADAPAASAAFADLCRSYWPPLYAFARRRGHRPHDAQDLVQGFFADLIESRGFTRADPQRGRFRAFLLGAFSRFLASEWERTRTQKRGGTSELVTLDADDLEARGLPELATQATPERVFEERWALTVVDRALQHLADEATARGKRPLFDLVRPFLIGDASSEAYAATAEAAGLTPSGVKTLVHRLRREFGVVLRREVARTLADPADVDTELQHLRGVLATVLP